MPLLMGLGIWTMVGRPSLVGPFGWGGLGCLAVLVTVLGALALQHRRRFVSSRNDVSMYAVTDLRAVIAQRRDTGQTLVVSFPPQHLHNPVVSTEQDGTTRIDLRDGHVTGEFTVSGHGFRFVQRGDQALAALGDLADRGSAGR